MKGLFIRWKDFEVNLFKSKVENMKKVMKKMKFKFHYYLNTFWEFGYGNDISIVMTIIIFKSQVK